MPRPDATLQRRLERVRLVLMDIDGTLVQSSGDVFGNVAGQLRRLRRFNVPFSLATGRTIAGSGAILDRLRVEVGIRMPPMINYNGAVMRSSHDGSLVERHVLSRAQLQEAVDAVLGLGLWPLVYACRDVLSGPPVETVYLDAAAPPSAEFNGMNTVRVDDVRLVDDDVVAILAETADSSASVAAAAILQSRFADRLRAGTSGSRYVEICSPEASKLAAMRRLALLHGIAVEEVMAIGDNLNDVDMIRAAGVGVAVGNAPATVKAAADYTAKLDSAQGVVETLRMLVHALKVMNDQGRGTQRCRDQEPTSPSA